MGRGGGGGRRVEYEIASHGYISFTHILYAGHGVRKMLDDGLGTRCDVDTVMLD